MLLWEEAQERILQATDALGGVEEVLLDASQGRVLAETIYAPFALPPFSASAMDGYALHAADLADATKAKPVVLPVVQEIPAHGAEDQPLLRGTCARIFTGAPTPSGADAVVMQEVVEREGGVASFSAPVEAGEAIRPLGSDARAGACLIEQGEILRAGEMGLLAALGRGWVQVARKPRVAILACGSELKRVGEPLMRGQIYESNRLALAAQIKEAGAEPYVMPLVADEMEAIKQSLHAALAVCDILLTSGGASVGDHDLFRPAFEQMDIPLEFWRIAIRPGKPMFFAKHRHSLIFGLPGNPASAMTNLELFVRPAIRKMMQARDLQRPRLQAILRASAPTNTKRTHFVRGQLAFDPMPSFTPLASQSSGDLRSMCRVNAFAILPPSTQDLPAGTPVDILWLGIS